MADEARSRIDIALLQQQVLVMGDNFEELRQELKEFKKEHDQLRRQHDSLVNKGAGLLMAISALGASAGVILKKMGL